MSPASHKVSEDCERLLEYIGPSFSTNNCSLLKLLLHFNCSPFSAAGRWSLHQYSGGRPPFYRPRHFLSCGNIEPASLSLFEEGVSLCACVVCFCDVGLGVRSHKYFSVIFALSFALILALYLAIC